jgi:hypothetical protein
VLLFHLQLQYVKNAFPCSECGLPAETLPSPKHFLAWQWETGGVWSGEGDRTKICNARHELAPLKSFYCAS